MLLEESFDKRPPRKQFTISKVGKKPFRENDSKHPFKKPFKKKGDN
ncbi:hypothetical protein Barb4_01554 [Bacteroidales bacterium Barb4]|nr:hypothetical protein Barb4_01554 [Bacteroidales bacterium Barb4]